MRLSSAALPPIWRVLHVPPVYTGFSRWPCPPTYGHQCPLTSGVFCSCLHLFQSMARSSHLSTSMSDTDFRYLLQTCLWRRCGRPHACRLAAFSQPSVEQVLGDSPIFPTMDMSKPAGSVLLEEGDHGLESRAWVYKCFLSISVSVLNSQSVVRNDVTSYALAR